MVEILIVGLAILVFELVAWFWGADSTDKFDSPEWERRRTWRQGSIER